MGERPSTSYDGSDQRELVTLEFGPTRPATSLELGKVGLEMALAQLAERVPTIDISMSNETKLELVARVAETITRYLLESPESYEGYLGLSRLVDRVSDATKWSVPEVYVIALPKAKGIKYSVVSGTVSPA